LAILAPRLPPLPAQAVSVSFDRERPARHPLCTCPELTWDAATGRADSPDFAACRARALGIDPHPVLDVEDLRVIVEEMRGRS
jgi:hypothetical protein